MLKEATDIEISKHIESEFYEFAGFITREKLKYFKADNIEDIFSNYELLSQGQYKPLIFDFRKMCSTEDQILDYELGAALISTAKLIRCTGRTGILHTGGYSVYDNYFRNIPPQGVEVLSPKLVEIKNLSYPYEIFLKENTGAYKIYSPGFKEFFQKDISVVAVSNDLHGYRGYLGEFNPDEFFMSKIFHKSLEEIHKLDNYKNLKYKGLFQVLPIDYYGAKAFFTFSNCSMRLYYLELDDSDSGRKNEAIPSPSEKLELVIK